MNAAFNNNSPSRHSRVIADRSENHSLLGSEIKSTDVSQRTFCTERRCNHGEVKSRRLHPSLRAVGTHCNHSSQREDRAKRDSHPSGEFVLLPKPCPLKKTPRYFCRRLTGSNPQVVWFLMPSPTQDKACHVNSLSPPFGYAAPQGALPKSFPQLHRTAASDSTDSVPSPRKETSGKEQKPPCTVISKKAILTVCRNAGSLKAGATSLSDFQKSERNS